MLGNVSVGNNGGGVRLSSHGLVGECAGRRVGEIVPSREACAGPIRFAYDYVELFLLPLGQNYVRGRVGNAREDEGHSGRLPSVKVSHMFMHVQMFASLHETHAVE